MKLKKRKSRENRDDMQNVDLTSSEIVDDANPQRMIELDESVEEKRKSKSLKNKKKKKEKEADISRDAFELSNGDDGDSTEPQLTNLDKSVEEKKRSKSLRNKKKNKEKEANVSHDAFKLSNGDDGDPKELQLTELDNSVEEKKSKSLQNKKKKKEKEADVSRDAFELSNGDDGDPKEPKYKSDKGGKSKMEKRHTSTKVSALEECSSEVFKSDEVYHISSVNDDCSKGMRKWVAEYHQSRPGLEILQRNIDEFIIMHEQRKEQARKEREALAAEGGWTVVAHQKGKKRTTDSESGISVGSVAPAAVLDKLEKKKKSEIAVNFYNFQRREARRNEVMMLQAKFEQDKKRIQQMRAARKFRPY